MVAVHACVNTHVFTELSGALAADTPPTRMTALGLEKAGKNSTRGVIRRVAVGKESFEVDGFM